jgi:hypothetical protein
MELKTAATRQSTHLIEKREVRIIESEEMNNRAQRALPEVTPPSIDDDGIAVTEASSDSTTLRTKVEDSVDLPKILCKAYHKDAMFSKIMAHPKAHKKFGISDGLIWTKNHAHQTVGHYSQLKTSNYILRAYWCPSILRYSAPLA